MTTIQQQIAAKIQSFASELEQLVRQAAVTAVAAALGTGAPKAVVRRAAKKGKAAKKAAKATPKKAATKPTLKKAAAKMAPKTAKKAAKRQGRAPLPIGPAAEKILGYVKLHPGQRSELVRKAVGTAKNIWVLAIAKLVEQKKITKKGEKRATTFMAR